MSDQTPPSPDELQQQARKTWGVLKLFFLAIFLVAIVVIGTVGYWLYHAFGLAGILLMAVLLGVGLFFLCLQLLKH
jgi:uncharacterized membrane protein (DUF485 family)